MGCDATNQAAVERIFAIKQRPVVKRTVDYSAVACGRNAVHYFATVYATTRRILLAGPLTIVAPKSPTSPLSPLCEMAITKRTPCACRRTLLPLHLRTVGQPIVATSANISGKPDVYDPADIVAAFEARNNNPIHILTREFFLTRRRRPLCKYVRRY